MPGGEVGLFMHLRYFIKMVGKLLFLLTLYQMWFFSGHFHSQDARLLLPGTVPENLERRLSKGSKFDRISATYFFGIFVCDSDFLNFPGTSSNERNLETHWKNCCDI